MVLVQCLKCRAPVNGFDRGSGVRPGLSIDSIHLTYQRYLLYCKSSSICTTSPSGSLSMSSSAKGAYPLANIVPKIINAKIVLTEDDQHQQKDACTVELRRRGGASGGPWLGEYLLLPRLAATAAAAVDGIGGERPGEPWSSNCRPKASASSCMSCLRHIWTERARARQ